MQIGTPLEVRLDGLPAPLAGKVSFVSPQAEYTLPIIYSRENRGKLVFLVEGAFAPEQARLLHRNGQFVLYSLTDEPQTTIHGDSIAWAVLQDGDSFEMVPYSLRFDAATVSAASKA